MDLTFAVSVNVILNLSNKVKILDQGEGTIDNKQPRFDLDLIPRGHEEEKIEKTVGA